MREGFISRGFGGRRRGQDTKLPPGQYLEDGFPVLSAGPTPRTPLEAWDFSVVGEVDEPKRWTWEEFKRLPSEEITRDIHCVTKWSKLGTRWEGVSVDTLLAGGGDGGRVRHSLLRRRLHDEPASRGRYGRQGVGGLRLRGGALEPIHGGPARLLVPHLYFWKSAKWVRGLRLTADDIPGFWESLGYHNYGDPWREQRYWGD